MSDFDLIKQTQPVGVSATASEPDRVWTYPVPASCYGFCY